ncbi:MAG: hypothetical protein P8L77_04785 [Gammaproteobacteria bacterium]|nr:hypothetical protein [Gammaproteobacteria bacterium]
MKKYLTIMVLLASTSAYASLFSVNMANDKVAEDQMIEQEGASDGLELAGDAAEDAF